VPAAVSSSDPAQPRRLEKKKNKAALLNFRGKRGGVSAYPLRPAIVMFRPFH
jgi:hypothetical protein